MLAGNALAMRRCDPALSSAVRALVKDLADFERRVAEHTADLAEAVERILAPSPAKTRFLATLSLELRTPVDAVIGCAELMADDLRTTQTAAPDDAERVGVHRRRLLTLIAEAIEFAEFDQRDIVGRTQTFLQFASGAREIRHAGGRR